nr:E3 SUMO-protein ligase PIAS2-like [Dermacentor andersoni]
MVRPKPPGRRLTMSPGGAAKTPGKRSCSMHPRVRFKRLPFYEVLAKLMLPTRLATSGSTDWQKVSLHFQFRSEDLTDIRSSVTYKTASIPEFKVQVHLRFCLLNTRHEQDDSYPSDLAVKVNGRLVSVPAPIPSKVSEGATEWIRLPIDIVTSCFLSSSVRNQVSVTWRPVRDREYVAGVFLVRKLSVATILSGLQQQSTQRASLTRAMIKKKMQRRANCDDVAVTSFRVPLTCPLSRARMSVPCRGRACKHLECFDASNYLQINERRPAWTCPLCGQQAAFSSLVVDQLFVRIVAEAPGDCDSVIFREDGSWAPSASRKEVCDIDDDAATSATPSSSSARSSTPPSRSSPTEHCKRPKMEVVDLTELSSSDGEEEEVSSAPWRQV